MQSYFQGIILIDLKFLIWTELFPAVVDWNKIDTWCDGLALEDQYGEGDLSHLSLPCVDDDSDYVHLSLENTTIIAGPKQR